MFFDEAPWTDGELSPHPPARALDGLVGTWTGAQRRDDGTLRAARLRAKRVNADCLVGDLLETRADADADREGRLCVRGHVPGRDRWETWRVSAGDTRLRASTADDVTAGEAAFAGADGPHETLRLDDATLTVTEPGAVTTLHRTR